MIPEVDIPSSLEGIIILNIPSFGGGAEAFRPRGSSGKTWVCLIKGPPPRKRKKGKQNKRIVVFLVASLESRPKKGTPQKTRHMSSFSLRMASLQVPIYGVVLKTMMVNWKPGHECARVVCC